MKLTKTQQYMIFALVGVVGLISAYYQFILKPLNADIVTLQSDLAEKQKKLAAAKDMLAKYDEFKKRSAATLRELEWAQSRMPAQLDRPKFIESVSALQARAGVSLTSFKFQTAAPASKEAYMEVPADIRFNASFSQLLKFLYDASVSKNLMITHDLKLTPYTDSIANSIQTVSVQMVLSGIQGKKP